MGTTGRFGGSGGLTTRGGHQWYDTDYSELYIGLAVVLGFFILLVLFLIILFTVIFIRRKFCAKRSQRRNTNIMIGSEDMENKSPNIVRIDN